MRIRGEKVRERTASRSFWEKTAHEVMGSTRRGNSGGGWGRLAMPRNRVRTRILGMRKGPQRAAPLSTCVSSLNRRGVSICPAVTQSPLSSGLEKPTRKERRLQPTTRKAGGLPKSTGTRRAPGSKTDRGQVSRVESILRKEATQRGHPAQPFLSQVGELRPSEK